MTFSVRSSVLLSHPSTLTSSILTLFLLEDSPEKLTHCEGETILNNYSLINRKKAGFQADIYIYIKIQYCAKVLGRCEKCCKKRTLSEI